MRKQRIVLATFDAWLFTLDARTGEPCPDFGGGVGLDLGIGIPLIEGRRHHFKETAPPAVIGDLIVVERLRWALRGRAERARPDLRRAHG